MSEKELVVEDIDRGKSLLPVTRSPWNLLWKVLCHIFIVNVTKNYLDLAVVQHVPVLSSIFGRLLIARNAFFFHF